MNYNVTGFIKNVFFSSFAYIVLRYGLHIVLIDCSFAFDAYIFDALFDLHTVQYLFAYLCLTNVC